MQCKILILWTKTYCHTRTPIKRLIDVSYEDIFSSSLQRLFRGKKNNIFFFQIVIPFISFELFAFSIDLICIHSFSCSLSFRLSSIDINYRYSDPFVTIRRGRDDIYDKAVVQGYVGAMNVGVVHVGLF